MRIVGWGARIRTWECRYQKPMPYHLATPQREKDILVLLREAGDSASLDGLQCFDGEKITHDLRAVAPMVNRRFHRCADIFAEL